MNTYMVIIWTGLSSALSPQHIRMWSRWFRTVRLLSMPLPDGDSVSEETYPSLSGGGAQHHQSGSERKFVQTSANVCSVSYCQKKKPLSTLVQQRCHRVEAHICTHMCNANFPKVTHQEATIS